MDVFYFSMGGLVFAIGIFKRELLVKKESFTIILVVTVVLFFIGVILHFTEIGRDSTCGALLCPLLSLGLYRLYRRIFIRRFNREPMDTWLNWSEGMGADRAFNIIYFGTVIWLWILCIVFMLELAKAGW